MRTLLACGLLAVAFAAVKADEELPDHGEHHDGHEHEHGLPGEHELPEEFNNLPNMEGLEGMAGMEGMEGEQVDAFSEAEIKAIFDKHDKNKDEKLDVEELTDWLEADVMDKLDTMDEETKKEMQELSRSDFAESANDILEEGDKDKDKALTREEFDAVMRPQGEDELQGGEFPQATEEEPAEDPQAE